MIHKETKNQQKMDQLFSEFKEAAGDYSTEAVRSEVGEGIENFSICGTSGYFHSKSCREIRDFLDKKCQKEGEAYIFEAGTLQVEVYHNEESEAPMVTYDVFKTVYAKESSDSMKCHADDMLKAIELLFLAIRNHRKVSNV